MKTSDLICPLLKEKCIREKCVCYDTRDYDTAGFGIPTESYGICSYLKLNLDYEVDKDEYGIKAVVIRDPYTLGADKELFTLIYYGNLLSSTRIRNLKKTGKSYAKELNTIFEGLKGEGAENG